MSADQLLSLEDGMPLRAANLARAIHRRVAETAVGPSTARGQGPSGVVQSLRQSLDGVDLADFRVRSQRRFASVLDRWTDSIRRDLPTKARSWGLARKCLNIFLRDCYYNAYLRPLLGAQISADWFEVPLDRLTAMSLKALDCELPRWRGVRHLAPETSSLYQASAAALAKQWEIGRVHLDTFLWIEGRRRERIALGRMGRAR